MHNENLQEQVDVDINKNKAYLKNLFKDVTDVVYREFKIKDISILLVYIDGMADKILLNHFIVNPAMTMEDKIGNASDIKDNILTVTDIKEAPTFKDAINAMLSGDTLMLIDGLENALIIASRAWPTRSIGEPDGETVIRGPRDGFNETIRFNTALIRRNIRDSRLKVKAQSIGSRSKTDVAVMYIEDIANKEIISEVERRLDNINIDAILDSGYVEQLIEDNSNSVFPQIQSTERPDVAAAAIYEGRVAILVDNSPFALLVPATLPTFMQSPDDYNQRWLNTVVIRLTRTFAVMLSLILPGSYIAVTSFNITILPTKLAYSIAATREGVPFPAFVEVIIMEVALIVLMESIARLPKSMGTTIGIVGGLVIGQAAVSAGIVSPIMVIIVGVTAITTFISPNYGITNGFRMLRFFLIICSMIAGIYGIFVGMVLILVHLIRLESFGISYLSPIVDTHKEDAKDLFVRLPISSLRSRPKFLHTRDKIRQR